MADHRLGRSVSPLPVRPLLLIGLGLVVGGIATGLLSAVPLLRAQSSSPLTIQPDTGRVGIGTTTPTAKLDVAGDIVANNVWVKLADATLSSAADYTVTGLNGNAYRRFKIELEGIVAAGGSNRAIGVRPNGATTNYAAAAFQHWDGHEPGFIFHNTTGWTGGSTAVLPLCVTHWNLDGHVLCTGLMNTQTGMFRMINSIDVFNTTGACGTSNCVMSTRHATSWRDTATNITSLTLHFNGATGFSGRFVLYAMK